MRRKNLSEELKINDDIVLDDGSELKDELEKSKEKYFDEVEKELNQKVKDAEEISGAEAPKVEANDGLGKSLKIKQFTEKLILEEPSDVLNEEVDTIAFDERDEAVHAVYKALEKYAKFLYFDANINDDEFDIFEELESVCEEVMMRLNDGEWVM